MRAKPFSAINIGAIDIRAVLPKPLSALCSDERGALAPVIAVFMPLAFGAAGLAVDVSNSYVQQNRLQSAVDEASLVGAALLPDVAAAQSAAMKTFDQYYASERTKEGDKRNKLEPGDLSFGRWDPKTGQVVAANDEDTPPDTIAISVERRAADGRGLDTYFLAAFGIRQLDLTAQAAANARGGDGMATCIIALEEVAGQAVHAQGAASIQAEDCRIEVNSTAGNAIEVTGSAPMGGIHAGEICVAGGAANSARMSPAPDSGCTTKGDPLADFRPPSFGTCDHHGLRVSGESSTLHPGVYCGGLTIDGSVTMAPGIYVIKDGPFLANGNLRIDAEGVALHLAGNGAVIDLEGPVDMNHKAPATGPLAGFAIYQNPSVPAGLTSRMGQGNTTTRIEGTIYMPDQHLQWGGTPGTTLPPWTLVVARTVYVFGNSRLSLGSRFGDSDVPKPEEFKEKKSARLVK